MPGCPSSGRSPCGRSRPSASSVPGPSTPWPATRIARLSWINSAHGHPPGAGTRQRFHPFNRTRHNGTPGCRHRTGLGGDPRLHQGDSEGPQGPGEDALRWHDRVRRAPLRRGAGVLPGGPRLAPGDRRARRAGTSSRGHLHDRAGALQPGGQPPAQAPHRPLLLGHGGRNRRAARAGARLGAKAGSRHRPVRHPAYPGQVRPVDGQHHPHAPLLRPQRCAQPHPGRVVIPPSHRGHRRDLRRARLGDGGGVQHQLPGASSGFRGGVPELLQRGPTGDPAGAGGMRQLPASLRQAALERDAHRAVRAVDGHAQRDAPPASDQHARALRRALDQEVGDRALRGRHRTLPGAPHRRGDGGSLPGACTGRRAPPPRAPVAQRHRVPLESPLLRHQRGQAASAHRVSGAALGSDDHGRGGQRGLLDRPGARGRPGIRRRRRSRRLRLRQGQLRGRQPQGAGRRFPLARRGDRERARSPSG